MRRLQTVPHRTMMKTISVILAGGATLLLTACSPGYSNVPTNTVPPTTPAVSPNACSLLSSAEVTGALGTGTWKSDYSTPGFQVSQTNSFGGAATAIGQCRYTVSDGRSLVVTVYPGTPLASLGYDIGPSATNGTAPIVKEAATSGIIALMSGQNAVEIALDRADISAASRSTELESLAKGL